MNMKRKAIITYTSLITFGFCFGYFIPSINNGYIMVGLYLLSPFILAEISTLLTFGPYLTDAKTYPWLSKGERAELNQFDEKILYIYPCDNRDNFIAPLPLPIFGRYYITKTGIVPYWSKSHKLIEQYYRQAKAQSNE